jgi:hypothetical protein
MKKPPDLEPKQAGCRPKEGKPDQQKKSKAQPYPNPPFKDSGHGVYSYEAHHLISGKQALAPSGFEKWIVKGKKIESDSGYSVNNADNGIWAPSIPEKYKDGTWGGKSFDKKKDIAIRVMTATKVQFHKGHHAISDPHDSGKVKHKTYDGYLKDKLKAMDKRMQLWTDVCPLCTTPQKRKKTKFKPSVRANQALDNLSTHMRTKITGSPSAWDVFISKYALEYHYNGKSSCSHGIRR